MTYDVTTPEGAKATALAGDQRYLAELVCRRLVTTGPTSWAPRVKLVPSGARMLARVHVGFGLDSYLYVTPEGLVRYASAVPPRWRPAISAALLDLGVLDLTPSRTGGVVTGQPSRFNPRSAR
jgi:hypothetical protein